MNYNVSNIDIFGKSISRDYFETDRKHPDKRSGINFYGCSIVCIESLEKIISQTNTLRSIVACGCNLNDNKSKNILQNLAATKNIIYVNLSCNNSTEDFLKTLNSVFKSTKRLYVDLAGNNLIVHEYGNINQIYDLKTNSSFWKNLTPIMKIGILLTLNMQSEQKAKYFTQIQKLVQNLCDTGKIKTLDWVQLLRSFSVLVQADGKNTKRKIDKKLEKSIVSSFIKQLELTHPIMIERVLNRVEYLKIPQHVMRTFCDLLFQQTSNSGFRTFSDKLLVNLTYFLGTSSTDNNEKISAFKISASLCEEHQLRIEKINLELSIYLGSALVRTKSTLKLLCRSIIQRWEASLEMFKTAISADEILRAFVICCHWKLHLDDSSYHKNLEKLIFSLTTAFNSIVKEHEEIDAVISLSKQKLADFVRKDELLSIFYVLSKQTYPMNHTFLMPFLKLVEKYRHALRDTEEISKFITSIAIIKPNLSPKPYLSPLLIIDLINDQLFPTIKDLNTQQLRDTIANYVELCSYYRNSKLLIKTFITCESIVEKIKSKAFLNPETYIQIVSQISSLLNMMKNECEQNPTLYKSQYTYLKSRHTDLVKRALNYIQKNEDNIGIHTMVYLFHSMCATGNYYEYYKWCKKFQEKLLEPETRKQFKGRDLLLLRASIIEFDTFKKENGDVSGFHKRFSEGKWSDRAEEVYKLALLIDKKNLYNKNFVKCLKKFVRILFNQTSSLDILDLAKLLFGLSVINVSDKIFNNIKKILQSGSPITKNNHANDIYQKALDIRENKEESLTTFNKINLKRQTTTLHLKRLRRFSREKILLKTPNDDKVLDITISLSKTQLFEKIKFEYLSHIARISEVVILDPEKMLFSEGDKGNAMFIIMEGKVKVHRKNKEIAILEKGQIVGEMALLDGKPRSASVTALDKTTLISIDRKDFEVLMANKREILQGILKVLAQRIRKGNRNRKVLGCNKTRKSRKVNNKLRKTTNFNNTISVDKSILNIGETIYLLARSFYEKADKKINRELIRLITMISKNQNDLDPVTCAKVLYATAVVKGFNEFYCSLKEKLDVEKKIHFIPNAYKIYQTAIIINEHRNVQSWFDKKYRLLEQKRKTLQIDTILYYTNFLHETPLFQKIEFEKVSHVAQLAEKKCLHPGEMLFAKGDQGDSMYIILDGSVKVYTEDEEIAILKKRKFFGELALLDGKPRSASVVAIKKTNLLRIDRQSFEILMSIHIEILRGILKELAKRVRETNKRTDFSTN